MIIVRIKGGLGNQLFQYAAGRALALRLQTSLKLDLTWFDTAMDGIPRRYLLGNFRIQAAEFTREEAVAFVRWFGHRYRRLTRVLRRVRLPFGYSVFEDSNTGLREDILTARGNLFLDGFWQSETYFADQAGQIREDLTLRHEPDEANRRMIEQIEACQAVSLHVRRGDLVHNPKSNSFHGVCSLDYYREAVALVASRVEKPCFFIFSDDPEWTKENLRVDFPTTYVTHNVGSRDYEDIRLMSRCQHTITANSSFSWWGAWLIRNPAKLVVCPRRWFLSPEKAEATIRPPSWIQL